MKRIPSWFLMIETALMALVLVSSLSTVTADRSSLLPDPVTWVIIVLMTLVVVTCLIELGRRKFHGS